jgi:hypothetical protein
MGICGLVAAHPIIKRRIPNANNTDFKFLFIPALLLLNDANRKTSISPLFTPRVPKTNSENPPSPHFGKRRWADLEDIIFLGSSPNQLFVQTRFLVARARKQAPKPKRAGRSPLCSLLFASAKRRGGKRIAGLKRRKPAFRKEEPPPFLARRMLFCPGREPACFRERPLFAEPSENKNFSEVNPFPSSTKLERILFLL